MRRVRDERQSRVSRAPAWLAVAAVLAAAILALTAFAWIAAGPSPSPSPSLPPAVSPSPASSPVASPTASPAPTFAPTTPPEILGSWHTMLKTTSRARSLDLTVWDLAGTMTGVAGTTSQPPETGGPADLAIGPGSDSRSITVGWTGGPCDEVARLELAADGRTLSLRFAPRPACDAMGIGFAVELRFTDPVDPAAFAGRETDDLVLASDIDPHVTAFIDQQRGFVGGRSWGEDLAVILETTDGGTSWRVEGLGGIGDVVAIGVTPDGRAWAGLECPLDVATCHAGFYRYEERSWGRVDDAWPVSLSFAGDVGAGLFQVAGGPRNDAGIPIPELRLMDEGEVWSAVENPCPTTMQTQDVSRPDASTVVVLCEGQGATGNAKKELHRSTDGGRTWTKLADGPETGTLMHMDLRADGTGWMWGARSPLLATADGGVTWTPLGVADGDVRTVVDADYLGDGMGVALIQDPDREQTLLRRSGEGRPWTELSAFPDVCCGG
ncbi:MAG: WD40/YVTN/BNR-like repeat-containing protein, partial [Candidatus Limnocylindrales bacterium]